MNLESNRIKFTFPHNQIFVLQTARDKKFGWELKAPDYHCQVKTLSQGLFLLGRTAPKRFGTRDYVFVRTETPRGPDEFTLTPQRQPFCANITNWELTHIATDLRQKFNDFTAAAGYFVELLGLKDKIRNARQPPGLTVI